MEPLNEKNESWKNDLITILSNSMYNNMYLNNNLLKIVEYYTSYAPTYIYKYYSDKPLNWENIENNKIWFSAPVHYNDVFDCDFLINNDAIKDNIMSLLSKGNKIRKGSPIWRKIQLESTRELRKLKDNLEGIKKTIGITCFSESFDSLLMWAHYANNHSGMCVEYELLGISKELNFTPVPVIYSNDRVSINNINLDNNTKEIINIFVKSITTKSIEWQYEREWRILRDDKACGDNWNNEKNGALLNMIKPHSIILGCMVNSEFESTVKKYCEENIVNLFKMEKDEKLFKLNKIPLLRFDEEDP